MLLMKKLFTVFCIIVCSYQLYLTTIAFFKFEVITSLDIEFSEWFTVPDTTMCVQFADAVNWTAWTIHHPNLLPNNCTILDDFEGNRSNHIRECFAEMGADDFEGFVEKHFTVNGFYKLVIKAKSLFESVTFFNKTGNFDGFEQNQELFCTTKTYLKDPHVCYHLACRSATNSSNYIQFNRSRLMHPPNPGALYNVGLDGDIVKSWDHVFVYIHSPLDLPRGPAQSFAVVTPKAKSSLFFLSFNKIIINALEPPYVSNCKDYHDNVEGIRSQIHKYEKCLNNRTLQLNPSFVMYQTIIENPQQIEANFSNRLRYEYKDKLNEIRTECLQLIERPECKSFYYIPYLIGHERYVYDQNFYSFFMIMAPVDPDIKLKRSPAFLLETYVVSIGSILGIWFGFSMVRHLGPLVNHTLKLKNISNLMRYNIYQRHKILFKKSVDNNCEQMRQRHKSVERLSNSYKTYGLLSRARAAIDESHWIRESRRSQSIKSRFHRY